ncbi:hypothetical protein KKC44_01685 [Patescibacteria group bacterium]|nr:hypothetical protein [Patescibacteria group bacterium]MBU2259293.1 hypothetical protein [Patescibacteria group bacterium]
MTHLLDKADKKSGSYLRASNQVDPSLDGEQQMLQFWKILSEDPEHAVRDRWIGVCMWGSVVSSMIGVALLCICYMPLP